MGVVGYSSSLRHLSSSRPTHFLSFRDGPAQLGGDAGYRHQALPWSGSYAPISSPVGRRDHVARGSDRRRADGPAFGRGRASQALKRSAGPRSPARRRYLCDAEGQHAEGSGPPSDGTTRDDTDGGLKDRPECDVTLAGSLELWVRVEAPVQSVERPRRVGLSVEGRLLQRRSLGMTCCRCQRVTHEQLQD